MVTGVCVFSTYDVLVYRTHTQFYIRGLRPQGLDDHRRGNRHQEGRTGPRGHQTPSAELGGRPD